MSEQFDPSALNLPALVEEARELGYDDKARVINRLQRMIVRNQQYIAYRQRRQRTGAYNETVSEDSVVLAMAIDLLENQ